MPRCVGLPVNGLNRGVVPPLGRFWGGCEAVEEEGAGQGGGVERGGYSVSF